MAFLGTIQGKCADNSTVHSRVGECDVIPGLTQKLLITPLNFTFPITGSEAMVSALKAGIVAGLVVPFGDVTGEPVTGGDAASYSTEHGSNIYLGKNPTSVAYTFAGTGRCYGRALDALSLRFVRIVRVDYNGMVRGNAVSATVGRGFLAQIISIDTEASSNTAPYLNGLTVAYSENYAREKASDFLRPVISDADFDGLMGVMLVSGAEEGTARIVAACGGSDQGIAIASMLESNDVKVLLVDATGANPTTADIDPDTGLISNIAPTAGYRIAPASVLDGLNVVGYDGINEYTTATGNPDA